MIDVGQTIGNYRITAKLGEGGMGIVFLAEHPVIGKKVAMKAIHPELSRNAEVISRFMTEAKSVNQIGNEHIVDISDFGTTTGGEFYFVMEYLQGQAMADRLKDMTRLPPAQALNIASQVADALGASHQHGIIHRDLKPENIYLVTRGGSRDFVKVLDFGLAKLTQSDEKVSHKTRTGSVMGTPFYMSPEQCEGKASIDQRADIYSLGVILFEMLTGKVPFGGEGYGEIIVKHITMPPPSARSITQELSPALDLILYRAMAKNRDERFQTMAEFQAAMQDPEKYAATAPNISGPNPAYGGGGGQRSAGPMSRSERDRASQAGVASGMAATRAPSGSPSTFRETVGEVLDEMPARSGRGKMVVGIAAVAIAAVAGLFVLKGNKTGHGPTTSAGGKSAVTASATPATVRVNFNSDPGHALIVRADTGQELGQTPLSTEIPYSDTAVEFVFKKQGFESRVVFVVPNLPSPLFATLQPVSKPVLAKDKDKESAVAAGAAVKPAAPPREVAKKPRKKPRVEKLDDDAVLEPTFK
jgi:tRNA A-37 threonylcarbamoyl transferase component Bud32